MRWYPCRKSSKQTSRHVSYDPLTDSFWFPNERYAVSSNQLKTTSGLADIMIETLTDCQSKDRQKRAVERSVQISAVSLCFVFLYRCLMLLLPLVDSL